jgi:hypothetical protein
MTTREARATDEQLHTFLNAAAGEGFVLDGVDAADLYTALYPERYAVAIGTRHTTEITMDGLTADVLQCQVDSLRAALLKVLDTHEKEAKAHLSYQTAYNNFTSAEVESRRHLAAMVAASNAEKEARLLLATLKTLNPST